MLRRILRLRGSASRMDALADEQCLQRGQGAEAGCLPGPHGRLRHRISQVDRPQRTEDSGLAQKHEAWGAWVGPEPGNVLSTSRGQFGEWKHSAVLPGAPQHRHLPLPGGGRQNNFSLPELQCFISDSQLTRDAALHLRLGDRAPGRAASPASAGEGGGGASAPRLPRLCAPPSARRWSPWDQASTSLSFYFSKSFMATRAPHPFKVHNEMGF